MMAGRKFLNGCSDLVLVLMPHLLIFLITAGLEKRRPKRKANSRTLMDLPEEILLEVFTRLPVKSLCRVQVASKTSSNIVQNLISAATYAPRLLDSARAVEVPQLMFVARYSFEGRGFGKYSTALQTLQYTGDRCLTKNNTKIFNSRRSCYRVGFVHCSLFFLESVSPPYRSLLVNPLRGEAIKLPIISDSVPYHYRRWFGMGFDNITSTHKIVCISQSEQENLAAYVCTLHGARSSLTLWREIHSVPECKSLTENNASAYGDMHWLIYHYGSYRIISFDFKIDEFVWTPLPELESDKVLTIHLLNFRGCLALVSSHDSYAEIWLLKDYEKKDWALEYKIDAMYRHPLNRRPRSIRTCGEWEHGIYFTESYPSAFYFWDVRYKSLKYIDPDALLPSVSGLRQPLELGIFSYTESLISLKSYGNLVLATETSTWDLDQ